MSFETNCPNCGHRISNVRPGMVGQCFNCRESYRVNPLTSQEEYEHDRKIDDWLHMQREATRDAFRVK